jgi:hypothetical protein
MNRVPPAYADAFRKHLSSICDAATFDDDERFYRMEEWQRHVELKWLNACKTYDSDRAKGIALASLGDPIKAGKRLRKPWWYRLALYRRLDAFRLFVIVAVSDLLAFCEVHMGYWINLNAQHLGMSVGFDIESGLFGVICAGFAWCSKMLSVKRMPILRILSAGLALGFGSATLTLFVIHALPYARLLSEKINIDFEVVWKSVFVFAVGSAGILVLMISLVAESLDLPSLKSSHKLTKDEEADVFTIAAMPFVRLARRLLRAGR